MTGTRRVDTIFSHLVSHAAASESGGSVLQLLCRRFPYHNRLEWENRLRTGKVLLDGKPAGPESEMRPGMRLEYHVEGYEEPAVPISFHEILCEGDLALVHKPSGQPVHKTGKVFVHTLANLYRQSRKDDAWTPLNRLDVETSGIVAFARSPLPPIPPLGVRGISPLRRFSPQEPGTRWKKLYLAVVRGKLTAGGSIDLPLAEKPGDPIRTRMHPDPAGKPAQTSYHPLIVGADKTLLLVRTFTGRKHQIRAHLAALGFPILGDKMYSLEGQYYLKRLEGELDAEDLAALGAPHHLLHAFHLEIRAEDGAGIEGTDFDLPESFYKEFPELREEFRSLPESEVFQKMRAD